MNNDDFDFTTFADKLEGVLDQVEKNLDVTLPIWANLYGNVVFHKKRHLYLILRRLRLVGLDKVLNEFVERLIQLFEIEDELAHTVFDARHLRFKHVLHKLGWALHVTNIINILSFLYLFRIFLQGLNKQHVGDVDNAVKRVHNFVTKTCGELLWEIVFQLVALIFEKMRDVTNEKYLPELSLEFYALDLNFYDLAIFVWLVFVWTRPL